MNTSDFLTVGLRLFFWMAMTLAIGQGSLFAITLCAAGFLVIEYYLEDINDY